MLALIMHHATVYLKTRGIDPKTHPVVPELVSNKIPCCIVRLILPSSQTYRTEFENISKR